MVLGAFWSANQGDEVFVVQDGRRMTINTPQAVDAVYGKLEGFVRALVASAHDVYLIRPTPMSPRFDPVNMISRWVFGYRIDRDALSGVAAAEIRGRAADVDRRLKAISKATGAELLDAYPDVCGSTAVCASLFGDGEPKFADGLHLRPMFVRDNIHFLDRILTN